MTAVASTRPGLIGTIARLRQCRDFQRQPIRAIWSRIWWKLRWAFFDKPCRLKLLDKYEIDVPRTGSGGLIQAYGCSEPETLEFVRTFLEPGMTFWDIGAHIGEFSIIAASRIGPTGCIEAFEPQPAMFPFLEANCKNNVTCKIELHKLAVTERTGETLVFLHPDPARAHLHRDTTSSNQTLKVGTISLDDFLAESPRKPDLIKVDVEGAEQIVLRGATATLHLPEEDAPVWLFEYDPQNCATFGYHPQELIESFHNLGYRTYWVADDGRLQSTKKPQAFAFGSNVVASKRPLVEGLA